ncbi:MAG: class B sortase [Eggerthellaceae bacterium]|nr:class B sortase [Eggerthellaceae bacterium]
MAEYRRYGASPGGRNFEEDNEDWPPRRTERFSGNFEDTGDGSTAFGGRPVPESAGGRVEQFPGYGAEYFDDFDEEDIDPVEFDEPRFGATGAGAGAGTAGAGAGATGAAGHSGSFDSQARLVNERFAAAQERGQVRFSIPAITDEEPGQTTSQKQQTGYALPVREVRREGLDSTGYIQARQRAAVDYSGKARPSVRSAAEEHSRKTKEPVRNTAYRPAAAGSGRNPGGYSTRLQDDMTEHGRAKRKASTLWKVIFFLALIVFIVSLVALGIIGYGYLSGRNVYKEVAAIGFKPPSDIEASGFDEEVIAGLSLADLTVNWEELWAKNPDTVAWIYIPGTVVNYPIVQGRDNVKYLTTDFMGGRGQVVHFGAIFLAAENSSDFSDPNNFIYGHHMNDGSMFACIDGFRFLDEFNSHRTIFILTPAGNYRLTTFALVIAGGNDPLAQPTFRNDEEKAGYFQDKINRSVVSSNPPHFTAEQIVKCFALVTCDYTIYDGRAVLYATVVESTVIDLPGNGEVNEIDQEDIDTIGEGEKEIG